MGTVTSLQAWRSEHGLRDPAERLERAVDALDALLRITPTRRLQEPEIERELLAITGAVSIGMLEEAAGRAEHLRDRLERRVRKGG